MSTRLHLTRYGLARARNRKETVGRLYVLEDEQRIFSCATLELPYRENRTGVSCIPQGRYVAEVVDSSPAFDYEHIWIHDPNSHLAAGRRRGVKIHVANYVRQLRGCVAVGKSFADLDGDGLLDVTHSETTLKKLILCSAEKMDLHIKNQEPTEREAAPLKKLEVSIDFSPDLLP